MRRILLALFACLIAFEAPAQIHGQPGAPDPHVLTAGAGEPSGAIASGPGFSNTNGRVLKSSALAAPTTTAVIITTWQSLIESSSAGTYTTTEAASDNLNIYDGGIYGCTNPVLGAAYSIPNGSNSPNCQIADSLIVAGTYTRVIMVPIAIGGSLCSDWVSGALRPRITVAVKRLQARGLTAGTGFTGDTWILPHGGETDNLNGTAQATLATCIRNFAQAFTDEGLSDFRFFVPTESLVNNTISATVQGAQADAVASGCTTCRQGANWDTLDDTKQKVLLHFDGADGSTTITDSNVGGSAHTWTAAGNAQIDTAQSKFGGASGLFDGTGDYVTTPDHADFTLGSGDWTIDLWFNAAGAGTRVLGGQSNNTATSATRTAEMNLSAANLLTGLAFVGGVQTAVIGTTAIAAPGWHHAAFVRTGNVLKLFLDGVQEGGNVALVGAVNDSPSAYSVGRLGEFVNIPWNGWIDEFQLTVGVAKWTANFTPPARAYGANRQDGVHFTEAGAAFGAALDVDVITACKNTAC